MNRTALAVAIALVLPLSSVDAGDWTGWRGPLGTGAAPEGNPPVVLDEAATRWKVAIPGSGHSSPIVLGNRIYLMTAVETDRRPDGAEAETTEADPPARSEGGGRRGGRGAAPARIHEFNIIAIDRADGSTVWSTTVREEAPHEGKHQTGTFASATPITDGTHLYCFFGSRGLYCLDLEGAVVWEKDLGDMRTRNGFGEGASPAVHGDAIVVPWDHEGDSFVATFDKRTGEERWRAARSEVTTWTSPVIVEVGGRRQVVVAGTAASISYDLETGEEIWRCSGLTTNVIPTPVVGHGMIYLTSGFRGSALQAVKLDEARGDISGGPAIKWTVDRGTPYVPSPLLSGRNLYFLRSNNGIVSCHDAVTGEAHFSGERLDVASVYASPVAAGGYVYICGREGEVVVLRDGSALEVVATSALGQGIDATPAIAGNEIFIRGATHLHCFARATTDPTAGTAD